jgi:hypothetical protein
LECGGDGCEDCDREGVLAVRITEAAKPTKGQVKRDQAVLGIADKLLRLATECRELAGELDSPERQPAPPATKDVRHLTPPFRSP